MKVEGFPTIKVTELKSKMYYIVIENSKEFNKLKGVNISFELEKYKNILFNSKNIRHKMEVFQSKQHNKSQKINLK